MDKWAVQQGRSLALSLVVMVILTTSLVIASYAFHTYQHRTEMLEEEILGQAQESAERLSRAITLDLQAGHLVDYLLLAQTEMSTANHKALLAILLEASQLESASEPPFSAVGLIKMPTGEVREFIPSQDNPLLASSLFFQQRDIRSAEGALLGHVKVYGSGEELQQEKRNLLLNSLLTALGLLLMQTVLSATLIQWILTRPLQRITNTLVERDADGLPTAKVHSSSYTELSVLTDTVNEMLDVICKTRDNLRAQTERLENVIEGTDAGTWYWNIQTGKTEFNPRWAEIIGYQLHELEPVSIQTWFALLHPEDVKKSEKKLQAHFAGEREYYQCEVRMRHRDGHWVWVMDRGKVALWDESGKPLEMFGTHIDISEDKAREQQLALAADVYKYVHEGILIANSRGLIVDVNRAFSQITGYSREEVIGQSPKMLKSGIHDRAFYHSIWRTLHLEGCWRGEIWNKRKNGEIYPELLTISRVSDPVEDVRYVALFSDISALKEHEYQLEKIAHYDALTKLPNRLLLQERLNASMLNAKKYGRAIALLFIDLDGFKDVNDQYGHSAGDEVLCIMAQRMKTITREEDTLARFGGDEFIVILSDIDDKHRTTQIVARLLSSIAKPLHVSEYEMSLSASIGISLYPENRDISADTLIQQADQAMYQAKLAGKNGYYFFAPACDNL
ncbi:diguanylate cyclase [Vibrio cidicii]|nr:diguanylate cyclase [Vibrio cidicii]